MEYQAFSSTAQRVLIAVAVCCLLAAAGQSSIADDTAIGGGVWQVAPVCWTAHPANPVLSPGPPGAWDEHIRERMWVIYHGGRFHGWYGGWKGEYDKSTPNLVHLGYATSEDGVRWTKHANNPVFTRRWVEDVCVVKLGDTYYLYGEDETENKTMIHLLTSTDGVQWTARGNVLEKTAGSAWEGGWVGTPVVWREPNRWCMLYEGGPPGDVGLATSADGVHWQKSPELTPFCDVQPRALGWQRCWTEQHPPAEQPVLPVLHRRRLAVPRRAGHIHGPRSLEPISWEPLDR